MAEQAQQEPTMEEILSSIRKIIADDEQPSEHAGTAAVSPDVVEVREADDDAFEDLDLTFDDLTESAPETDDEVLEAISQADPDNDVFESVSEMAVSADDGVLDDIEDDFELNPMATEIEPAPFVETATEEVVEPTLIDDIAETEPMTQSAPLSDSRTADAAAGSLGKLLSKVEFGDEAGGNNTIEGVVRELLRPMLKEWLDDNLPGIVDKHVEAEVQRIARMAR